MYLSFTAILFPAFHLLHTRYNKARDNVMTSISSDVSGSLQKMKSVAAVQCFVPLRCLSISADETQTVVPFIMQVGLISWLLQCCHKYVSSSKEISMNPCDLSYLHSPTSRCKINIILCSRSPSSSLMDILWYASGLRQQLSSQVQWTWLSHLKSQCVRQSSPGDWFRITSDLITFCAR